MAQTRNRANDLTDRIFADFFAGIGDNFLGDALHLAHAQPGRHHLGAGAHDAAHREHAAAGIGCLLHERLRSGKPIDEGLHLVGGAFLAQEVEDDTDGSFGGYPIDADIGDETRNQLFHVPLMLPHWRRVVIILNFVGGDDKQVASSVAFVFCCVHPSPRPRVK